MTLSRGEKIKVKFKNGDKIVGYFQKYVFEDALLNIILLSETGEVLVATLSSKTRVFKEEM